MKLHELAPAPGSKKDHFRVGRGTGSGTARLPARATRARTPVPAAVSAPVSKAARCPLYRRLPKRGFNNYNFATNYAIVKPYTYIYWTARLSTPRRW